MTFQRERGAADVALLAIVSGLVAAVTGAVVWLTSLSPDEPGGEGPGPSWTDCVDSWNGPDNSTLRTSIAGKEFQGAVVESGVAQDVYEYCYVTLVSGGGWITYTNLISDNVPGGSPGDSPGFHPDGEGGDWGTDNPHVGENPEFNASVNRDGTIVLRGEDLGPSPVR